MATLLQHNWLVVTMSLFSVHSSLNGMEMKSAKCLLGIYNGEIVGRQMLECECGVIICFGPIRWHYQ